MNTLNTPMTKEESAFAAENHDLVCKYLRMKRYSVSELYDTAIFGYLRAVRTYLLREDLRAAYNFQTIAFQCMRSSISHYFCALKRGAAVCFYDDDTDAVCDDDSVWENVSRDGTVQEVRETLSEVLTPRQNQVVYLKAYGYNNREIGDRCGIHRNTVGLEIKAAGDAIRNHAPELMELLAA